VEFHVLWAIALIYQCPRKMEHYVWRQFSLYVLFCAVLDADVEMVFSRMLPIANFTVEIEKFLVLAE